jgi:L-malate glycosyltransferase
VRVLLADLERVWRGGQEQALFLLQGLRARGHRAELLAIGRTPLALRAAGAGIAVHTVGGVTRGLGAARVLRRLLGKRGFDIVHANEAHALTAAWLAGAHRRAPLVVARRVALPFGASRLARSRYRAARRIIAISNFVARSVVESGWSAAQVAVVYDGVDVPPRTEPEMRRRARERWGIGEGQPLLGCVGYLLPEKGQALLVRALPAIRERFADCRLLLAGDGPCRAFLEQLSWEMGVEGAVLFAGHVQKVSEVYGALDVFVFPSLAEPLGSSLLTAMANGLPVVANASGGVAELVTTETGVLVAPPEPERMAAAVVRLLADRESARRLGEAARERVRAHFSADRMVEETLRIFERLAGPRGAA